MPRFSFDDFAEPPPPRWGRRVLVAAVVLVVLAGAGVGVAAWVGRGPAEPNNGAAAGSASPALGAPSAATPPSATPAPAAVVNGVLFEDRDTGRVGVSSPSGADARTLTTVAPAPGTAPLFAAVSPARTTVLFPDGSTLELATGRVTPAAAPGPIGVIPRQPWASSGTTLTLEPAPGGLLQPTLVVNGSFTLLGSASGFAADPRFAGVFAVGPEVGATAPWLLHEGQLPAAGAVGGDVTLASGMQLAAMVGLPAGAPFSLGTPVVTNDGSEVAVPVSATIEGTETTGWAVVGADGHPASAVPAAPGRPGWAV